ncbi:MAG: TnsD family Tn7-like transposition protein [Bradyrhizobium sp.]
MAAQLPYPYPDELLYSVFARYFAYFPLDRKSGAVSAIAGRRWSSVAFGADLDRIASATKIVWGMEAHDIIERHTLLPFYGAFLDPADYLEHVRRMCAPSGNARTVGNNAARQYRGRLRFCPLCAAEDVSKFGETYWRRCHQLDGVTVCLAHDRILFDSTAEFAVHTYRDATQTISSSGGSECVSFDMEEHRVASKIAARCIDVLEGGCNKWTRIDAEIAYSRALKDQGFNIGGMKIHSKLLDKEFGSFYHYKLLRKLDKFNTRLDSNYHIKGGVGNPLENVLLQYFLEQHVEKRGLNGAFSTLALTGWKCPNENANHQDSFRIQNVVKRKSSLGADYLHAKCTCGFAFSFETAREDDPLMPVPTAISGWADSQKDEANRLFKELHTVRAVALAMKVSHRTASKLITRQASKYEATPEKIENLRRAWQKDHSRASYQALLKYDREWIVGRKDRKQMNGLLPISVQRDEELASVIRAAITKLNENGETVRLYKLSRELGFRLVRTQLADYPLSKAEVLAVCPVPLWLSRTEGNSERRNTISDRERSA